MNYYNPYFYTMPTVNTPKIGLLSRIFKGSGLSFSSILSGTQKVLGVANQAIPLVKQVQPMMNNAKTMFKIMNEFKKSDNKPKKHRFVNNNTNNKVNTAINTNSENNNTNLKEAVNNYDNIGPTFFI